MKRSGSGTKEMKKEDVSKKKVEVSKRAVKNKAAEKSSKIDRNNQ